MPGITLELPELTPIQQQIRDCPARFRVARFGRRAGKTHYGLDEAIEVALEPSHNVGWFSPTYKLLAGEGGAWPTLLRMLPQALIARLSVQDHTLRLVTGSIVEMWSLENGGADKARGREYDVIVVDEAAMVPDLLPQWDNALRPMLATRQGRGLFLSTPRGFNDFKELCDRGTDDDYPEWASFHAPSNASPFFPADEWRDLLRAVERGEVSGATFAQEYEALFTAAEGLVYGIDRDAIAFYEPSRNIRSAPVTWAKCRWRVVAIDPGGNDPTGMLALGVTSEDRMHVYAAERLRGLVPVFGEQHSMHEWLSGINAEAPIDAVMVGETGGGTIVKTLRRLGWRAFPMSRDRGAGIQRVRSALKSGRLTIAPSLRMQWEEEVYVYRFAEQKPGASKADQWATVVDSTDHHAELLDCVRYAVDCVHLGYPGAAIVDDRIVPAGAAQSGVRAAVTRARRAR